MAHRLAHDQRLAVGRNHAAVGKLEVARGHARRAVGLDHHQLGLLLWRACNDVVAEVADIGAAPAVDHHVVAVIRRERAEVGV